MVDVIADDRGQRVRRRRDGVHITGEVQVDVLHRHDLRITATGCAALDTHDRPLRRFADRHHRLVPGHAHRIGQPDQGGGLALACGCGAHRRDQHELAPSGSLIFFIFFILDATMQRLLERRHIDLRLGLTEGDQRVLWDPGALRDGVDVLERVGLGDLNV